MAETRITFACESTELEGLLNSAPGNRAAIITHPHPLYGGDMYNHVVEIIAHTYHAHGYSTLRFNFRGVGTSGGCYDHGVGEQLDIQAATEHLGSIGKTHVEIAGYSFGAWVAALALNKLTEIDRAILISPPVDFLDFSAVHPNRRIALVTAGSHDQFARAATLQARAADWNPDAMVRIMPGTDHFYGGKAGELRQILRDFLAER